MAAQRFGKFEVTGELGRGGQGSVLRARDPAGRLVALKVLLRADDKNARRFRQEAQVLARLAHPGIVRVLDAGVEDGVPWLAMALVEGESLRARLERTGPLEPRGAAHLVAALARAVACCHESGIVHRDLKPENVLVDARTGQPVLVDFGLIRRDAEVFGALSIDDRSRLSRTGELRGTPAYMAPEQVNPARFGPIGPATDIYGLGGVLCALLTGDPPHVAESLPALMVSILEGRLPDLAERRPGVPASLAAVCLRALAARPDERWPSALALADALEASSEGRDVSTLARGASWRWHAAAAAALLLTGGVAAALAGGGAPAAATAPLVSTGTPTSASGLRPAASTPMTWAQRVDAASRAPWPARAHVHLRHVQHLEREAPHVVRACFIDDQRVATVGPDRAGVQTRLRVWTLDGEASTQSQPDLEVPLPITSPWFDLGPLAGGRLVVVGAEDMTSASFLGELVGAGVTPWPVATDVALAGVVAPAGDDVIIAHVFDGRTPGASSAVARARRDGSCQELFRIPYIVRDLQVSGQILAAVSRRAGSGGVDPGTCAVVVWDLGRGQERYRAEQVPLGAWALAILPGEDGRRIVIGKGGGFLNVIDTRTGEQTSLVSAGTRPGADGGVLDLAASSAHTTSVNGLALGRDGTLWSASGLAVSKATLDGELRAWRPGGAPIDGLTRPEGGWSPHGDRQVGLAGIASLAASPDGRALVAGGDQGEADVWILPESP